MLNKVSGLAVITLIAIFSQTAYIKAADPADWTIMLYMDADNDLEYSAIWDFTELAAVGSTSDVNIVVQMDRAPGYSESDGNWTDCKRFYVTLGMTPTPASAVASLGEVDMSSPQTLEDFVTWTIGLYPAEKYALILWNHGWLTFVGADSSHGYEGLSATEIYNALDQVFLLTGTRMDIVGIHACFGASIEMAYHISEGAPILVASEEVTTRGRGYPYHWILSELVADPTMNATAFAMVIHSEYVLLNEGYGDEVLTSSVFNTSKIADDVVPAVANLTSYLNLLLPTHCHEILHVINQAATGFYNAGWRDLYHFCQLLAASLLDLETADAAHTVMNALLNARIAEWHDINAHNLHGLSIYLPPSDDYYDPWYAGTAHQWTSDTTWDEFLQALFVTYYPGTLSRESFKEASYTLLDSDSDDHLETVHVRVDADTTGVTCNVSLVGQLINSSGSTIDVANASWSILGNDEEWGGLNLSVPQGSEEDWYDVELFLYDDYGILEDHRYSVNWTRLPQAMQHDVSVEALSFGSTIVGHGFPAYINVTIRNPGHYTEVVNVTTSANGTLLNATQLILPGGNAISFTIIWETHAESLGNYTITSYAEPVEGEVSLDDNTLTGGPVTITIPGDIDGDCDVDIYDIVLMSGAYGSEAGDQNFAASCDIDGDSDVDIYDVVIACGNYGQSW